MADRLIFLPAYRRQFPMDVVLDDGNSNLSGTLSLDVTRQSSTGTSGTPQNVQLPITMTGPGDVVRINRNAIACVEPPPNTNDFEPNYFPFIEFRDLDFPWRYSLSPQGTSPQPWLVLIVLSQQELAESSVERPAVSRDTQGVSWLRVKAEYVPSTAADTAHVQLTGYEGPEPAAGSNESLWDPIHAFIASQPSLCTSRLFCPRKLEAQESYVAFLVPFYLAGTGVTGASSESVLANVDGHVELPIYFSWAFMTSESGDFEKLARELKRRPAPPGLGKRPVDATRNFPAGEPIGQRWYMREGALSAPDFDRRTYPEQLDRQERTRAVLDLVNLDVQSAVDYPVTEGEDEEDPVISLPYYGRPYQLAPPLMPPPDGTAWSDAGAWHEEINLDFRNRIAAGLGTRVVQQHQEDYLKESWYQVGAIRKANEQLRLAQAAVRTSNRLSEKHLDTLSDERFTLRTAPFHDHVAELDSQTTFGHFFTAVSGLSPGLMQPAFSRIVCGAGVDNPDLFRPWRLAQARSRERRIIRLLLLLLLWLVRIGRRVGFWRVRNWKWGPGITVRALWRLVRWIYRILVQWGPEGTARRPNRPNDIESRAKAELAIPLPGGDFEILPPKQEIIPVTPVDLKTSFRPKFNVPEVVRTRLNGVIVFNDGRKLPEAFDPILESPEIDDPMYRPLEALSVNYILAGQDTALQNSVSLCEENRRFIEAYLVGLNNEMSKELAWRGYPTDRRGTVFRKFWDPTMPENGDSGGDGSSSLDDIRPIHEWDSGLGANPPEGRPGAPDDGRVVLLIKGDLIRRYPDTIIFAVNVTGYEAWSEIDPDVEDGYDKILPVFRGQIGADGLAVGFPFTVTNLLDPATNYYFVLQENQDLPRFGLDIQSRIGRAGGITGDAGWTHVEPDNAGYVTDWTGLPSAPTNTAEIASATLQRPIQMVIHYSRLVETGEVNP